MVSKVDKECINANICKYFKPPICYVDKSTKHVLSDDIIQDLELEETIDISGTPILDYVFDTSCNLAQIVRSDMAKYYTTNHTFIKNTKSLIKKITPGVHIEGYEDLDSNDVYDKWLELKGDTDFKDKYNYIDWEQFEYLNNNSLFLQILSMYNLSAPIIALLVPVISLFIPFLVIQARGSELSFSEYVIIFKEVAQRHALGKLITRFSDVSWNERCYLLVSASIYLFSLYQNTQICIKFYNNMFKIHDTLFTLCKFMESTTKKAEIFIKNTSKMRAYRKFNDDVIRQMETMNTIVKEIRNIQPFCFSYKKLSDMGDVLKCFYGLHCNEDYNETISFAFGFNGYISNLEGIKRNILQGNMSYGLLKKHKASNDKTKLENEMTIKNIYYPTLVKDLPKKNSIKLQKDCIITGPNASGKTTMLKSVLINILLTQQYGCGFYDKMSFIPYHYLHCYLNVPDTSGRDSLFQSESRKCKKILDKLNKLGGSVRHFCLFDELYSGTNPKEAVKCGYAYLSHLSNTANIHYMLTTHYTELCEKFSKKDTIENYKMLVKVDEATSTITYTYKIVKGVNDVDGGVEVLRQMNYPVSILNKMNEMN